MRKKQVEIPPALMKALDEMRCVFFMGAGVSIGESLPSVKDLVEMLHDEIKRYIRDSSVLQVAQECLKSNDLLGISTLYENKLGRSDARLLISRRIIEEQEKISPVFHPKLGEIAYIKHIITTNWDTLIEDYLPKPGVTIIRKRAELRNVRQTDSNIYKIHGCITDPNDMVLDFQDHAKFEKTRPALAEEVRSLLRKNVVVCLGYSMQDTNFAKLVNDVFEDQDEKMLEPQFFVTPSDAIMQEAQWQHYGFQHIKASARDFIDALLDELKFSSYSPATATLPRPPVSNDTYEAFTFNPFQMLQYSTRNSKQI